LLNNDYWFLWLFDYAMMHRKTCNGLAQSPKHNGKAVRFGVEHFVVVDGAVS